MKIAVISDIHENLYNLVSFYEEIENENIEYIFCLWDLINNWVAKILAFSWIPVKMVWWNNDGDKVAITKTSLSKDSKLEISATTFDIFEIDWKKIFLTHYPMLAKPMAKSWDFDAVFYWHNHIFNNTKIWDCIVANPWEISAHKTWKSTYAIYDTKENSVIIKEIKDFKNMNDEKVDKYREKIWFSYSKTKEHKF